MSDQSMSALSSTLKGLLGKARQVIPPLGDKLHKGQAGRVGVVGGSQDYTGAPFFSAMSAMRLGADLSTIMSDYDAGNVIKTYSPDSIVNRMFKPGQSVDDARQKLQGLLPRLHCLVVGPGLGRDDYMQQAAKEAIKLGMAQKMPIVIDADGLYLVEHDPDLVKGYKMAVLTPNVNEFSRLCTSIGISKEEQEKRKDDYSKDGLAAQLAKRFEGPTIFQKGSSDIIATASGQIAVCDAPGGLKRCGGQGDILTGTLATFLHWSFSYDQNEFGQKSPNHSEIKPEELPLIACAAASTLVRTISRQTFAKMGRATQTNDMLPEVGIAYNLLFGDPRSAVQDEGKL